MNLPQLINHASDKTNFTKISDYVSFCVQFLDAIQEGLQAVIVSQNENDYRFFQYKKEGNFNVSRPINSQLMYDANSSDQILNNFLPAIEGARDLPEDDAETRSLICRGIYSLQQSIGAALDGLPAGKANSARKVNGDLFERLVLLLIQHLGVDCKSGVVKVPVVVNDEDSFTMSYQHDLRLGNNNELQAIGSVKTSSKDRIDKIFIDKFLYNRLTESETPHFAIFLNDVQRKKTKKENKFGVSATFLSGRFKGYSIKLNPLDGVFYCDIRPNMTTDNFLKKHITTIDHFFCSSLWEYLIPDEG